MVERVRRNNDPAVEHLRTFPPCERIPQHRGRPSVGYLQSRRVAFNFVNGRSDLPICKVCHKVVDENAKWEFHPW